MHTHSEEELQELTKIRIAEEKDQPIHLICFSFANDEGFLGGLIMNDRGPVTAITRAREQGITPTIPYEVVAYGIEDISVKPDTKYWDRLLSKEELGIAFKDTGGIVSVKDRGWPDENPR